MSDETNSHMTNHEAQMGHSYDRDIPVARSSNQSPTSSELTKVMSAGIAAEGTPNRTPSMCAGSGLSRR